MYYIFMVLLFLTAVFLIVLVLIQRGKGGGLAGALGGMGGKAHSARRPETCLPESRSAWPPSGSSCASAPSSIRFEPRVG